jgi:hypothetical protein
MKKSETKLVKSKRCDDTEYEIFVDRNSIKITKTENSNPIDIYSIEAFGKVKDIKNAYEIAEKYILDLERDFENYTDISKAFASICEFKIDSNSYFGEKNDFLGEEARKIMEMFKNETGNQIRLIFSTDEGKNHILIDNNLIEIMINQHSLKIEDGHIEIQSYLYELQDFVEQLEKVEDFFSETVKLAFSKLKKINE